MKRLYQLQFSIQGLMLVIGSIAGTLALLRWMGPLVTVLVAVFPFSLLVERLFSVPPPSPPAQLTRLSSVTNLIVLMLCAFLCVAVSWYGSSHGVPTIVSPMPLLV